MSTRIVRAQIDVTAEVDADLFGGKDSREVELGLSDSFYNLMVSELQDDGVHLSNLKIDVKELKPDAGVPEES